MAAVGGDDHIAVRLATIGKPDGDAIGMLFHAGDPLAELHLLDAPEIGIHAEVPFATLAKGGPAYVQPAASKPDV